MRTASLRPMVGPVCLAVSLAGWVLVALVVRLAPGGHPPLAAYVTVPVLLLTFLASGVGCLASARRLRAGHGSHAAGAAVLVGNALVVLGDAAYVLTRI